MNEHLLVVGKKLKQYPVIFVCGILIPIGLLLIIMRGPLTDQTNLALQERERKWSEIQKNIERSRGLAVDVDRITEYADSIQSRLMRESEVARNYEFFFELEEKGGVQITRIQQKPALDNKSRPAFVPEMKVFSTIPFEILLNGEYSQIIGFLEKLERQDYIIRVESVNLIPMNDATRQGILSARVQCYVMGEKNDA